MAVTLDWVNWMAAPPQQILYAGFALLCAVIASVHDVRERRIPNVLTGSATAGGLLLHLLFGGVSEMGWAFLAMLIAGGGFFVIFLAGGMGAGDVKLMAAVGAIVALPSIQVVLLATVFTGAVFALATAIHHGRLRATLTNVSSLLAHHSRRGIAPHPEFNLKNEKALRLPFALPIAAGCAIHLAALVFGVRS